MATWRSIVVLGGFALVAAGAWLLAVAPRTETEHRVWDAGEPVAINPETGNRTWEWSFRLSNTGSHPMQVQTAFRFNMSDVREGDGAGEYSVRTRLYLGAEQVDGVRDGGNVGGPGNYIRYRLDGERTLRPGEDSMVRAEAAAIASPRPGTGWEVRYDPVEFEVTTTTRELDWMLAGPGTGLLLAGFAAVAVVAVPGRPS